MATAFQWKRKERGLNYKKVFPLTAPLNSKFSRDQVVIVNCRCRATLTLTLPSAVCEVQRARARALACDGDGGGGGTFGKGNQRNASGRSDKKSRGGIITVTPEFLWWEMVKNGPGLLLFSVKLRCFFQLDLSQGSPVASALSSVFAVWR